MSSLRVITPLVIAAAAFTGAYAARQVDHDEARAMGSDAVYAPSARSAPFLSLGYRELASDLFYVRLRGYFGSDANTGDGVASLVEAIVALDPTFYTVYEFGAMAMTLAKTGVDQSVVLRAVAVLEAGTRQFPTSWRLPMLAGLMYSQDLTTTDPAVQRQWNERAVLLTEAAIRKPDAPTGAAVWAAGLRTKMGQQQRAIDNLRELYLVTPDDGGRKRIADKLAKLQNLDSDAIQAELVETRRKFKDAWERERPAVRPSTYILIGPPLAPAFDLGDLATGGHDLIGADDSEPLEPLPE